MSLRRLLVVFVGLAALVGCTAKVVVVKIPSSAPAPAQGVIYALPNTVVRAHLRLDKTEYVAARYAAYGAIFAPDGKPVCKKPGCVDENASPFSVQDDATFSTYGEPDPGNVFLVKFVGKGAIDQSVSMTWNEAGLASAASSSVTNRTGDVVLSALKLAAGLGTKAALGASEVDARGIQYCKSDASNTDPFVITTLVQEGSSAALQLIANYCGIKKADRDTMTQNKELLTDATKDYANRLLPLSAAKLKILAGTSLTMEPVELLAKIDTEIDHQLVMLYLGTKKTTTWDGALDVRALSAGSAITILRVNHSKGFCIGASEVPPELKRIPLGLLSTGAECDQGVPINLRLDYYPSKDHQLFTKLTDITEGERGFCYRIPAQVQASLSDTAKTYGAGIFSVAQLGTVISLPANRHSKMLSYDLGFIESTGGLKTFKLGTTGALDAGTIDALSSVGGGR